MSADAARPAGDEPEPGYRTLPPPLHLDETIESVDPDSVPDPHAGRNVDQHAALRDD